MEFWAFMERLSDHQEKVCFSLLSKVGETQKNGQDPARSGRFVESIGLPKLPCTSICKCNTWSLQLRTYDFYVDEMIRLKVSFFLSIDAGGLFHV